MIALATFLTVVAHCALAVGRPVMRAPAKVATVPTVTLDDVIAARAELMADVRRPEGFAELFAYPFVRDSRVLVLGWMRVSSVSTTRRFTKPKRLSVA